MSIPSALLARPENRILHLCARGKAKSDSFVVALEEVQDWKYLTSQLQFHRLLLLFLHHVRGHENLVPAHVLEELQRQSDEALHLILILLAELQRVTHLLTEQGVRILSYKGPSLAYSAYDTVSLRRFADLDLLVSPKERSQIISLLKKADFQALVAKTALTPYLHRLKLLTNYEILLESHDRETYLDLHWFIVAPFESFPFNFEQMWKRRVLAGSLSNVYTLCREDLIVALCFHGLKHSWEEMEWIGCLLNLIQKGGGSLDWHFIQTAVTSSSCQRVLQLGLHLARDLADGSLEESVPAEIWRKIEVDTQVERMAQRVWHHILTRDALQEKDSNRFQFIKDYFLRFSLGLCARQGLRTRWVFFVGMLRTGLLSLERSKIALKIVEPFLKLFERALRGRLL